jgi:hypothetical protein
VRIGDKMSSQTEEACPTLVDDMPIRLSPTAPLTTHGTPGMVSTVPKPHDMQRTVRGLLDCVGV